MKVLLTNGYLEQITLKHQVRPWGGAGHSWIPEVIKLLVRLQLEQPTILDYGAGRRTFSRDMKFISPHATITEYDPGVQEISAIPTGKFDIVLCTDVMEHVEEQFVDETLDRLRAYTSRAALLNIVCKPATSLLPNGENTHVTVRPPSWWLPKLACRWRHVETLEQYKSLVVVLMP